MPRIRLLVSLLVLGVAAACVPTADAAWMIPPGGIRPKDFALVKRDGVYHLFYIRRDPNLPFEQTERDLGHAISGDLFTWTQLETVLPARPESWDRHHVWAPSIVLRDGVYYMFYTGVSDTADVNHLYQRTGVATSTDLMQWNRLDAPVLTCAQVPWTLCDSLNANAAFRDPFVMADPTTPGRWLMYYSTVPASAPSGMIVGVAASSGDFTQWSDLKPLWITHRSLTFNQVVESPHVFRHDSLWYLLFTTTAGQPLSFATSTNPLSDPAGWTYRGRLGTMLNANTTGWFASEHLRDGNLDYFAFVNGDRIEILRMGWNFDWRFYLVQPDLFHVQRMSWSSGIVRRGQGVTLNIETTWWYGRSAELDAYEVDADGTEELLPAAEMGLPAQIPMTGSTTPYYWVARYWPDGDEDGPGAEIVFRTRDRTAESPPLTVLRGTLGDPSEDPPPDPDPAPDLNDLEPPNPPIAGSDGPRLRMLRSSPLGPGPALLAELEEAAPARLDVFDLQGRRVRTLAERALSAGATVLPWDGRDADGLRMPRGVYFARLTTPAGVRTARLVLLR